MTRRARRGTALALVLTVTGCDAVPAGLDGALGRRDDAGLALDASLEGLDAPLAPDAGLDARATGEDAGSDVGARCPERPTMGLFVWTDALASRRDEILALAEANDVTEIYLHANLFYAGDLDESVLSDWIAAANARCIEVELLFANRSWILPAGHAQATARTEWTAAFAASHPATRPSGIHFDLEPQQLDEWDVVASRPTYISHLVDVLEAMTPVAEAAGLPLSNDLGFFLDGYDVTRGGMTRPGHEWVIDAVSRAVVMDYRDSAESMGFGGMISLAEDEVSYASSVATPIVLAVETQPIAEEYVTFREEGRAAMLAELALVRAHFASEPSFAGFAIHDEDGLAVLPP